MNSGPQVAGGGGGGVSVPVMMMTAPPPSPPIPYLTQRYLLQKGKSAAAPKTGTSDYSESPTSKGPTLPPAYSPPTYGSWNPCPLISNNRTGKGRERESDNKPAKLSFWSAFTSSMQQQMKPSSKPLSAPSPHPSQQSSPKSMFQYSGSSSAASAFSSPAPPSGPLAGAAPSAMFGDFGSLVANNTELDPALERQEEFPCTPLLQEGYKPSRPAAPKVSILCTWDIFWNYY
jgi:hypothetical protein